MQGWPLRESFDEFIEPLSGTDLKVECVTTIFDAYIKELGIVNWWLKDGSWSWGVYREC